MPPRLKQASDNVRAKFDHTAHAQNVSPTEANRKPRQRQAPFMVHKGAQACISAGLSAPRGAKTDDWICRTPSRNTRTARLLCVLPGLSAKALATAEGEGQGDPPKNSVLRPGTVRRSQQNYRNLP